MPSIRQRTILRHGSEDEINSSSKILAEDEVCIVKLNNGNNKALYGDGITTINNINKMALNELDVLKHTIESANKSIEIQNKKYKKKIWNASAMRKRRY